MRVGFNPNKNKTVNRCDRWHQVVIPVYIPNEEGYFKDGFSILKLCLRSLFKSIHDKTYVTIVNNGSCKEVQDYLEGLRREGKIQELIQTSNIGYINAMLKGIAGHNFPFFTNADSDVLFLNGWQEESYKLFEAFPKLGAVSPVPNPKMIRYNTANILFEIGFSKSLKFTNNKTPKTLNAFAHSVGNKNLFNEIHLKKYLTVSKGDLKGVVGAGHFIVTYRSNIFNNLKERYTDFALGGNSDIIFDFPVIEKGYWRLATENNFALHMGNVIEDWMKEKADNLLVENKKFNNPGFNKIKSNRFVNWFIINIFAKIIFMSPVWKLFLIYKGLTNKEADIY